MPGEFLTTLATESQIEDAFDGVFFKGRPEPRLAFIGRSNVGKSSLINALLRSKLARVSKEPGKTRCLHAYYWPQLKAVLIDLPGYGYAKASHGDRNTWAKFIHKYFELDEGLREAIVLLDARVGPTAIDEDAIRFFNTARIPLRFVMTKTDQVKTQSDRARRKKEVVAALKALGFPEPKLHWVSAEKKSGIEELEESLAQGEDVWAT